MYAHSITRALALAAVATFAVAAPAADQDYPPQPARFAVSLEAPPQEPFFFWDRFNYAFEGDVNNVFVDALNPLNSVRWNLEEPGPDFSGRFYSRTSRAVRGALVDAFDYGTREAALEMPIVLWLDGHQGWFADLLRDSVGNVAEQSITPLNVSYRAVEESWWHTLLRDDETHYGIRPFSSSPYAYVGRGVRDGADNVLFLANLRYYYDHLSEHRFELAVSVPLMYGLALDLGSGYQFGTHDERNFAVRLLKELKGGGIVTLGVQMRQRPIMMAGITFTW